MFDEAFSTRKRSPEEISGSSLLSVLPCYPSRGGSPLPPTPGGIQSPIDELRQAKMEIELLKSMDPFRAADMAIELQVEKMRVAEATSSRDSAVQRLASAYDSIKEKALAIGQLQAEKAELERRLTDADIRMTEAVEQARVDSRAEIEGELTSLREAIRELKDASGKSVAEDSDFDDTLNLHGRAIGSTSPDSFSTAFSPESVSNADEALQTITNGIDHLAIGRSHSVASFRSANPNVIVPSYFSRADDQLPQKALSQEPADMVQARNSVLASLPIPQDIPDDALKPILIPPPFTIHEFLGNTSGSLRNSLSGYRAFHEKTTRWCPDREEHGYFLTPVFRCTTKPRVPTAHSWDEVDPRGRMTKPTECFYHREGKWYYAGQYVTVRLNDLSIKEWEALEPETTSMLVKETVAGRKNSSPTVHYEVSQLYAVGALKIACVGLQCVGFNSSLYRTILEQAAKCQQNGRWKIGWDVSEFSEQDAGESNTDNNFYRPSLFSFT